MINPATGTATTVAVGRGTMYDLVVSPNSRYAYVSSYYYNNGGYYGSPSWSSTVSVINPATGTATTIPVGSGNPSRVGGGGQPRQPLRLRRHL